MRLIDADALYEQTAEWEARALAVVEKIHQKPFEEMDVTELTEWRKWSAILAERTTFKHDVADAPTIEPKRGRWEWNHSNGEYFCSECKKSYEYNTLEIVQGEYKFCPYCGARNEVE